MFYLMAALAIVAVAALAFGLGAALKAGNVEQLALEAHMQLHGLENRFQDFRMGQHNELVRQVQGLQRSMVYVYDVMDPAGKDPATRMAHALARSAGVEPALPVESPTKGPAFELVTDDRDLPLSDPRD